MLATTANRDVKRSQGPSDDLGAIQRLRYEVYCLERQFRDAADCPDGREHDEFDPYSVHVYATDGSGAVAGTVRLIRYSPLGLPIERHGTLSIPSRYTEAGEWAEISRLIVAKDARRQKDHQPLLLLELFGRTFEESRRLGMKYLVAAMEPALWRLLRRVGFPFEPIGPAIDYFGTVVPYGATVDALEPGYQKMRALQRQLAQKRPELAAKFQMGVAA